MGDRTHPHQINLPGCDRSTGNYRERSRSVPEAYRLIKQKQPQIDVEKLPQSLSLFFTDF
jgi:hypothetical protein